MTDKRMQGREDNPKRAATGAQQFMVGANKSIRAARKKILGIADNEFIADINVLIDDVKNTKTPSAGQKALDRMNSKMDSYFSNKKAIREGKSKKAYGGKAKMMSGGKVKKAKMMSGGKIKKTYAMGGGIRKANYK